MHLHLYCENVPVNSVTHSSPSTTLLPLSLSLSRRCQLINSYLVYQHGSHLSFAVYLSRLKNPSKKCNILTLSRPVFKSSLRLTCCHQTFPSATLVHSCKQTVNTDRSRAAAEKKTYNSIMQFWSCLYHVV